MKRPATVPNWASIAGPPLPEKPLPWHSIVPATSTGVAVPPFDLNTEQPSATKMSLAASMATSAASALFANTVTVLMIPVFALTSRRVPIPVSAI
jgi:hypothetical protein